MSVLKRYLMILAAASWIIWVMEPVNTTAATLDQSDAVKVGGCAYHKGDCASTRSISEVMHWINEVHC